MCGASRVSGSGLWARTQVRRQPAIDSLRHGGVQFPGSLAPSEPKDGAHTLHRGGQPTWLVRTAGRQQTELSASISSYAARHSLGIKENGCVPSRLARYMSVVRKAAFAFRNASWSTPWKVR